MEIKQKKVREREDVEFNLKKTDYWMKTESKRHGERESDRENLRVRERKRQEGAKEKTER